MPDRGRRLAKTLGAAQATLASFRLAPRRLATHTPICGSMYAFSHRETLMLIPYDQLEPETLTRLIEDFVTRDGTDNGDDTPLQTRVLRVRQALTKAQAFILFDLESQQCQLMLKHDIPKELFD